MASVWMDKKPVTMLSTFPQADVTHTAQRRQRDGLKASVQCPDTVVLYNRYMAGVGKGDQFRQYYCVRMKSIVIFFGLCSTLLSQTVAFYLYTPPPVCPSAISV